MSLNDSRLLAAILSLLLTVSGALSGAEDPGMGQQARAELGSTTILLRY